MKYILLTTIYSIFMLPAYAETSDSAKIEKAVEEQQLTYMDCFKFTQAQIVQEQEELKKQIALRDLPATVETEGTDITELNPRINPAAADVKASVQIDMPQRNKKEANNSLSSQCKTLYGLE
jgi:hypothetical protein